MAIIEWECRATRLLLPILLLSGAAITPCGAAFEMTRDPAFTQKSGVGVTVGRDPQGRLSIGSEAVTQAAQPGAGPCEAALGTPPPQRIAVSTEGWIRMQLVVPSGWADRFGSFAAEASTYREGETRLGDLQALLQRANALLEPMVQARIRPATFEVEVMLVPAHCHTMTSWEAPPADAMQAFVLHVHVQEPTMLEPLRFRGLFRWLLGIVVHEGMHLLQLSPFDRASLSGVVPTRGVVPGGSGTARVLHLRRLELGAMLLEHCVTEALVPREEADRMLGRVWVGDRRVLERLRSPEAPEIGWMIQRFEWMQDAAEGVIYPDDDALLLRQLAACAAMVREPALALRRHVVPSAADVRAANEGLQAARRLGPAFRPMRPPAE